MKNASGKCKNRVVDGDVVNLSSAKNRKDVEQILQMCVIKRFCY